MNKKNLLITSAIISLSLLNVENVKAEEPPLEPEVQNEQIENLQSEPLKNTTSDLSPAADDHELQKENSDETSDEFQEKYNEILEILHNRLNDKQKELVETIQMNENESPSIFKEALVLHQDQEYEEAIICYEELLANLDETNDSSPLLITLIEDFKQLAVKETSLWAYQDAEKEAGETQEGPKEEPVEEDVPEEEETDRGEKEIDQDEDEINEDEAEIDQDEEKKGSR